MEGSRKALRVCVDFQTAASEWQRPAVPRSLSRQTKKNSYSEVVITGAGAVVGRATAPSRCCRAIRNGWRRLPPLQQERVGSHEKASISVCRCAQWERKMGAPAWQHPSNRQADLTASGYCRYWKRELTMASCWIDRWNLLRSPACWKHRRSAHLPPSPRSLSQASPSSSPDCRSCPWR
jgi:hypothetical protein